jgi:hypothetical protein
MYGKLQAGAGTGILGCTGTETETDSYRRGLRQRPSETTDTETGRHLQMGSVDRHKQSRQTDVHAHKQTEAEAGRGRGRQRQRQAATKTETETESQELTKTDGHGCG